GDCIRDRNVTVVQTCALPIWIGSLSWPVRGRFWCRWVWLFVCSTLWARLLAADWVVVLAVVVVDGVFHKSVRRCGCSCWPRCGWPRGLSAPLALALPVRLRRSVLRHSVGAWCVVDGALPDRGRLVAVVGVDGSGWVRVRAGSSVFEGVGGVPGRRLVGWVAGSCLGRLGCLLVDDFCGAGVGLLSVRGCGLRWWPLTWSSRVTVRRGLRVGEAAPRWCEAVGEAVGCCRDAKRCVIVTQHVVG